MKTNIKRTRTAIAVMIAAASLTGQSAMADFLSYKAAVLADNPTGFWCLNLKTGTTIPDVTANANDLTMGSDTDTWEDLAEGPMPGADTSVDFTPYPHGDTRNTMLGIGAYKVFPTNNDNPFTWTNGLTVEFWIKSDQNNPVWNTADWGIVWGHRGGGFGINKSGTPHMVNYGLNAKDWEGATAVPANTWAMMNYVWDGATAKFYINGAPAGSFASTPGELFTGGSDMVGIGHRTRLSTANTNGQNNPYKGAIGQVAVFHSLLTDEQILAHYTQSQLPVANYYTWVGGFDTPPSPTADGDGDGLKNAVEYVLGTNPSVPNTGGPAPSTDLSSLIVSFERSASSHSSDTTVFMDVSTNLTDWTPYQVGVATEITVDPPVDGKEHTTLTLERGSDPIKFARLRVVVAPQG